MSQLISVYRPQLRRKKKKIYIVGRQMQIKQLGYKESADFAV